MDYYIKQNDLKRASLVAHEVMLQELTDNQLTLAACLFSCLKYSLEANFNFNETEVSEDKDNSEPVN